METKEKYNKSRKQRSEIVESVLKENDPSVTILLVANKKNGKKYIVETVSDEEIMRRRNSAYKFLM